MIDPKQRSIDPAAQQMIQRAADEQIDLAWDRYEAMQPQCGFGELGICCRNCHMGPCRIDPFGKGPQRGVCGASADVIVARNLIRMIAAGPTTSAVALATNRRHCRGQGMPSPIGWQSFSN